MSKYLTMINRSTNFTVDSRGLPLTVGDILLFYNYYDTLITGRIVKYENQSIGLDSNTSGYFHKTQLIKLMIDEKLYSEFLNKYVNDCFTYLKKSVIIDTQTVKNNSVTLHLNSVMSDLESIYKIKNNRRDTRNFSITECFGQRLVSGDLVLYYKEKYGFRYGIIISNTQVLDENLEKVTVHFVLKLNDLTENEIKLQKYLYSKYNNMSRKICKDSDALRIGNIYKNKDKLYVYTGETSMSYSYLDYSNTVISWRPNLKNAWLVLSGGNLTDFYVNPDYEHFIPLLSDSFALSAKIKELRQQIIYEDLYATYYDIYDSELLTTEIPMKASYIGKIKLPNEIYIAIDKLEKSNYSHSNLLNLKAKIIFKLNNNR